MTTPTKGTGMQSRAGSLLETCLNVASGFVVSLLLWTFIVVPIWNLPVNMGENLVITGLFTVSSVARGYLWRRYFNGRLTRCVR